MKNKKGLDWILRFAKGMLIGTGAILPGVSGGALAAVFGLYERMISFIAKPFKEFKKNFTFFLPVGIGGVFGIFLLSFALSFFFENAETQILWFFIGCIIGIFPTLFKQAGEKGRKPYHFVIMAATAVLSFLFLWNMQALVGTSMPKNFYTWMMAGGIFGLGLIIPGLSPSNFLVYLDMYKPMTDGIKNLDFSVIIPLGLGGVITILALSRLMDYIFKKAYGGLFHFILGVIIASTLMIVPRSYNYLSIGTVFCVLACAAGVALGAWMSKLEEKYKT